MRFTGGFKRIRREALEAIDLERVRAEGYVFPVAVTYRALRAPPPPWRGALSRP